MQNELHPDDQVYDEVYCFQCLAGQEKQLASALERTSLGKVIVPRRMKTVRIGDQWRQEPVVLFPGYVFLYCRAGVQLSQQIARQNGAVRLLQYAGGQTALTDGDRRLADWILQNNGMIGLIKAVEVGSRIEIIDSVFKDLHGTVLKMDKRRRSMLVSLDGDGMLKRVWLAFAVIKAENTDQYERLLSDAE